VAAAGPQQHLATDESYYSGESIMAAPNLNSPTTITGKTAYATPANTSEATLLTNAAGSGKALRLTAITVANLGIGAADITVSIYSAAAGGTEYRLASTVAVPAYATLVLLGRDSSVWIEEDRRITVRSSAANSLTVVCSYEEVS
jgi:hypothetical protein